MKAKKRRIKQEKRYNNLKLKASLQEQNEKLISQKSIFSDSECESTISNKNEDGEE